MSETDIGQCRFCGELYGFQDEADDCCGSAIEARTRIADEIGVMPEELDEDPALLRLTGITYRDGVATLGPLMFCLTERDGSIGVWVNEDSAPDGPALASGDNVTDALWNLLHKSAVPA